MGVFTTATSTTCTIKAYTYVSTKPPSVSQPQRTIEELIKAAIRASQIKCWRIRWDRDAEDPAVGRRAIKREEAGWQSLTVCDFNEQEYRVIRNFAKSLGENCHKGRRENENGEDDYLMGSYLDDATWYQFRHLSDLADMRDLIEGMPERNRILKIPHWPREARQFLVGAHPRVIRGDQGMYLFYNGEQISQTDEMLLTLTCGSLPITNPADRLFP